MLINGCDMKAFYTHFTEKPEKELEILLYFFVFVFVLINRFLYSVSVDFEEDTIFESDGIHSMAVY